MSLHEYSLTRQLGRPAAYAPSEVWYALDPVGRPVVVKLLKSKLAADVQRFSHEADCARKLVSPNVAQVWESGMEPEPYIVFEYIDGRDLTRVAPIRNLWEYLRTAEAIAAGLAAIHEQGIAHRDIKPDNIRYERDGHAKIVDLGIALTNKEAYDRQTVVPPGTEGWIAPERRREQLLEVAAEQKADIFSTGLLLAYLRTGVHPFGRDQRRIENSTEHPDLARVDEHLRDLLRKTLDRDPSQRPEAKELLRELRRLARQVPASPRRRIGRIRKSAQNFIGLHRKPAAVVAVSLSATLGLFLTYVLVPDSSATNSAAAVPGTVACPIGHYEDNLGDAVLTFGTLLPKSGPLRAQELQQREAVKLALKDVRSVQQSAPGIQIVPLSGTNEVDEGDPVLDTACDSTDTLLTNQVDVIIGPSSSVVTHKVIDRVISSGTILFSPSNTAPEFTEYEDNGLYFRTMAPDTLQGRVLGKVVAKGNNSNVLIISRDDSYGNGLSRTVERSLKLAQVDVLPREKYDPRTKKFDPLINRVVSRHPEAIVLIGYDESASILKGLRNVGITPQNTNIYGAEGNMKSTLPPIVGGRGILNGMRGTTVPTDPKFTDRLNRFSGGGIEESRYAAETYDAVIISALAVASAETDNPTEIAKKINELTKTGQKCTDYASCVEKIHQGVDIDYDGISGPLEFNEAGEPCMFSYLVAEYGSERLIPLNTAEASNLCVQLR